MQSKQCGSGIEIDPLIRMRATMGIDNQRHLLALCLVLFALNQERIEKKDFALRLDIHCKTQTSNTLYEKGLSHRSDTLHGKG